MPSRFSRQSRVIACVAAVSLPLLAAYACSSSTAGPPLLSGSDASMLSPGMDAAMQRSPDGAPLPTKDSAASSSSGGDSSPQTFFDGPGTFCGLPGSIVTTSIGTSTVPGGVTVPDVSYVHVPPGFCVHYFAQVNDARQLRFAPGGELFVASPSTGTTGGGPGGLGAIQVIPDDDHDGVGDTQVTFQSGLPSTQGLLFTPGSFYYQDGVKIQQLPYTSGQRQANGTPTTAMTVIQPQSGIHWTKVMDMADDGSIYVTNGGDESDQCLSNRPLLGTILKLDGTPNGTVVAKGYRNPIALRCHHGFGAAACVATELVLDYSTAQGGREKLTPIVQGADWGFPCCATANTPYGGVTYEDTDGGIPDCSQVSPESNAFLVTQTPFGIDFAPASWPAPYTGSAFVALHGAFSTWTGARLVAIVTNPMTGLPLATAEDAGTSGGNQTDFAVGWDDNKKAHGRPAAVSFSADGRLFLANDVNGTIVWISPVGM